MTLALQLAAMVGWRGMIAASVGALLAALAAYPAGRVVERAVCAEHVARRVAEFELQHQERRNARIEKAIAARLDARSDDHAADAGGLPDDGFRRD